MNDFKCNCVDGYSGQRCDVDIDECAAQPCQNGGTCYVSRDLLHSLHFSYSNYSSLCWLKFTYYDNRKRGLLCTHDSSLTAGPGERLPLCVCRRIRWD